MHARWASATDMNSVVPDRFTGAAPPSALPLSSTITLYCLVCQVADSDVRPQQSHHLRGKNASSPTPCMYVCDKLYMLAPVT